MKKFIQILFASLFIYSLQLKGQSNYKHQVGVDPGMIIQLFSINENVQGINYKYNFYKNYSIKIGGYASYSNNNSRTISNELRLGIERAALTQKQGSIFYGSDLVRYKTLYNNREEYILKKRIDLIFGLKINTLKNLAISVDYRIPFEWTSYSDIDLDNSDEFTITIGESINFMIIFQF